MCLLRKGQPADPTELMRNMEIQKQYIIDTNVLLEDPDALFKLRNGNENSV